MGHAVIRLLFSLFLSLSDERSNSDKEQDWLKVGSSIEYAMVSHFEFYFHLTFDALQGQIFDVLIAKDYDNNNNRTIT